MKMNFVISGASRGIGHNTAKALLNKGHQIWALTSSLENVNQLQNEGIHAAYLDLKATNLSDKLNQISFPNHLHGIINNAGILVNKPIENLSTEDMEAMWKVNVLGPTVLLQFLLPKLQKGSHIVNIGSMGGFQGSTKFPGLSMYSATKGSIAILSECWANELASKEISVNCLALGAVDTTMLQTAFPGYKAPVSAEQMGMYVAEFLLNGHQMFNGKILPVAMGNP